MTVNRPAWWTVDAFPERIVAVDPARADVVKARRSKIIDVFERFAERESTGSYLLQQPVRVDVLIRVFELDIERSV